ncbi:MAG: hypothetical protein APF80_03935 [Alphaproteobacteria bacterium BRH_c36]|nr:MAG: hypothetical protein APF80_03935 [Alphaproteobacteria bacterium BRH_c36]
MPRRLKRGSLQIAGSDVTARLHRLQFPIAGNELRERDQFASCASWILASMLHDRVVRVEYRPPRGFLWQFRNVDVTDFFAQIPASV